MFSALPEGHFLQQGHFSKPPYFLKKNQKNENFFADFLEKLLSYPEIYFGHPGTIWSLRNRFFRKKSRKKSETQVNPPPGYRSA